MSTKGIIAFNEEGTAELHVVDSENVHEVVVIDDTDTTSAEEFEEIVSELEAEHCAEPVKEETDSIFPLHLTAVCELDRIQKKDHDGLFKGTQAIGQLQFSMGDIYKQFDIGENYIIDMTITKQQMDIYDAPKYGPDDDETEEVDEPETEPIPFDDFDGEQEHGIVPMGEDYDDEPIPEPDGPLVEE